MRVQCFLEAAGFFRLAGFFCTRPAGFLRPAAAAAAFALAFTPASFVATAAFGEAAALVAFGEAATLGDFREAAAGLGECFAGVNTCLAEEGSSAALM